MPGRVEDRQFAREEGIKYEFLTQPLRFMAGPEGRVSIIEMQRMQLGAPDSSGRPRPVPKPGSEFLMDADLVVLALGFWPDKTFVKQVPGLDMKKWGEILVDADTGMTTRLGMWAAGDAVNGADLASTAMAGAHRAAESMHRYLMALGEEYTTLTVESHFEAVLASN